MNCTRAQDRQYKKINYIIINIMNDGGGDMASKCLTFSYSINLCLAHYKERIYVCVCECGERKRKRERESARKGRKRMATILMREIIINERVLHSPVSVTQ